jgi:hypothetical protein
MNQHIHAANQAIAKWLTVIFALFLSLQAHAVQYPEDG